MRVLILGGNGFIGSAAVAKLLACGHEVTALARDPSAASRRMPAASWIKADLAQIVNAEAWTPLISNGIEAVVNCAGVLQDGGGDDVEAVQENAMKALYLAASAHRLRLIVQISASVRGIAAAQSPFLSTKRAADAALKASGIPYVILRPAMVIGRNAYGGSALLRGLAAFPWVTPLVHAETPVQFAALEDVVDAIAEAIDGAIPAGSDLPIAARQSIPLAEAIAKHRAWLGLAPARTLVVPAPIAGLVSRAADALGHLGWRSPLRSTAMIVAGGGVVLPAQIAQAYPSKPLDEILAAMPAGVQDLWFARLYILKPVVIGVLSLFWITSGLVALARVETASGILAGSLPPSTAALLTVATSLLDIALGAGVLLRRWSHISLFGMIVVSLGYLAGSVVLTPELWIDPLGPLIKVLPSTFLALTALAVLEER
jgi:uncharacterized protein YbjT (DUF2867 family)